MYSKKRKIIIWMIVLVFLLVLTLVAIWDYNRHKDLGGDYVPSQSDRDVVYYEGEEYKYNGQIKNFLFLGIDNDSKINYQNMSGAGGQADCIILLSMNREAKTLTMMQIPRDSMTDIDIYDDNGNYYTSIKGQLALQYAYTNGAKTSCWATKKTVSELLFELPIDGYVAMDIAAISKINDLLGGIKMTMEEDYTDVDPAFVKGETLTLTGAQAERFVRYRDTDKMGSSHVRMQRQAKFIPALMDAFEQKAGNDAEQLKKLYDDISAYVETDLSMDDIEELMKYSDKMEKQVSLEGEIVQGEEFEEFYLDDEKLKSIIIKMFYKKL